MDHHVLKAYIHEQIASNSYVLLFLHGQRA